MFHFLGIGAQKSGTTWLYQMLDRHPDLSFPAGKEIHFWDQRYDRGIAWYRSLFSDDATALQGDITPAYAILPAERIRECHSHFPDLRLIYLIRNPVERAWSSALMALHRSEMTLDEASDQWFIDHFRSAGSRKRGDYAACIAAWQQFYPESQLLIRPFETLAEHPRRLLNDVCTHLGVSPEPLVGFQDRILYRPVRPGHDGENPPPRGSLLPHLRRLYEPGIRELSRLLGQNFDHWFD